MYLITFSTQFKRGVHYLTQSVILTAGDESGPGGNKPFFESANILLFDPFFSLPPEEALQEQEKEGGSLAIELHNNAVRLHHRFKAEPQFNENNSEQYHTNGTSNESQTDIGQSVVGFG